MRDLIKIKRRKGVKNHGKRKIYFNFLVDIKGTLKVQIIV